jgi:hypothetical protein
VQDSLFRSVLVDHAFDADERLVAQLVVDDQHPHAQRCELAFEHRVPPSKSAAEVSADARCYRMKSYCTLIWMRVSFALLPSSVL